MALLDSRKSITFSESLKVLGVVENMSGFTVGRQTYPALRKHRSGRQDAHGHR